MFVSFVHNQIFEIILFLKHVRSRDRAGAYQIGSMATSEATTTSLLETVKRLLSRLTAKALSSMSKSGISMTDKRDGPTVFCSQDSQHGDLLIRKEYLITVLINRSHVKVKLISVGKTVPLTGSFHIKVLADGIVQALTELVAASSEGLQCYFTQFLPSNMGHINIKLCRPYWFSQCIKEVAKSGNSYGAQPPTGESFYLYTHDAATVSETDIKQYKTAYFCKEFHGVLNSPVSKVRGILLVSVFYNILTTLGYTVVCCDGTTLPSSNDKSTFKSALYGPAMLPYLCDHSEDDPSIVCSINVRKYLMERNLIGSGGFSSNLNTVTETDNGLIMTGCKSSEIVMAIPHDVKPNATVIHVTHHRMTFTIEKAVAISSIVMGSSTIQHHILYHSGVKTTGKMELMFSQLLSEREALSLEACRVRYGATTSDAQLELISCRMAEASIKFDLFSVDPKCQVRLKNSSQDLRSSGSFVLYNYARIATLMNNFQTATKKNVYPPMPPLSDIDFSLLTDECEWVLLFQYIAAYPSMIKDIATFQKQGLGLYVVSDIKKLCIFLVQLSRKFSSYYSRVKILLEPQTHLLPLMYARLTLVNSIKQVMHNSLEFLSIEPIDQL
ncbi:uncharacterized protein [Dysidea avara]|uniref:uncharacterized protein isoform X2 n=1 Tax=Dysidea avara TaxID=196820 RepID=UPI003319859B